MARSIVRIPLEVTPEKATEIDRAVGQLQIVSGERQTRASFVRQAIDREIARVTADHEAMMRKQMMSAPKGSGARKD